MLTFIGLGLGSDGIPLGGLRWAQSADAVYAEIYTSLMPGLDLKHLEEVVGKPIKVLSRETVEGNPAEIIEAAKAKNVAFLVPGDPMVATTHVDLRLRAAKAGVATKVIHAASIASAAAGLAGLQSYKFGPSATIPFQDNPSTRPYDVLAENLERGLHTMLLLDIGEGGRAMFASQAIEIMFGLEDRQKKNAFTPGAILVVAARVGSDDAVIKADQAEKLRGQDFGQPPHMLIVPGKLHFMEAEALKFLAGAPEAALLWNHSST